VANDATSGDGAKWAAISAIAVCIITQAFSCYNANADRAEAARRYRAHEAVARYQLGSNLVSRIESQAVNQTK
jgi:hypothetical protein